MSFPRIYSLSTVGVLKHYIHDYLLHPIRTDIIGPNGVGKSIIADLLQMLFIYDVENIKFGTDSLKNDQRSINTLPYGTNTAYCFLNVEVSAGQFLILGIAISAVKGSRIVPFVIAKGSEIDVMPIDELALSCDEVLFSRDLLEDKSIPILQDLPKALLKKGLYINIFRTKEEVNRYYKFLFNKEILPLNLSIDKNLKAFSKVIQSFSKAKTLDLSKDKASKSLQEFLFEESDREILDHYAAQQESLDKILREYDTLNNYIKTLTDKQKRLTDLSHLRLIYTATYKKYKKKEIIHLTEQLQLLRDEGEKARKNLDTYEHRRDEINDKLQRFPRIEELLNGCSLVAKRNLDNYSEHLALIQRIDELDQDIERIQNISLPVFDGEWKMVCKTIDIKNHSSSEFIDAVNFVKPYLKKYSKFSYIEESWKAQHDLIQEKTANLNSTKKEIERIYNLLMDQSEKSLINWCLDKRIDLSDDQKDLVSHFLSDPISRPEDPLTHTRYLDPTMIILDPEIDKKREQNGFWLKLGGLSEFIEYRPEDRLNIDADGKGLSLSNILSQFKKRMENCEEQLDQLVNINKGRPYDRKILDLEIDLDLVSYKVVDQLKEKMSNLVQWEEKLQYLKLLRKLAGEDLLLSKINLPLNLDNFGTGDPKAHLRRIVDQFQKREKDLTASQVKLSTELVQTVNKIEEINKDFEKQAINLKQWNDEFENRNQHYFDQFGENVDVESEVPGGIDELKVAYDSAYDDYKDNYRSIVNHYENGGNDNPVATAKEVELKSYSFTVLEQALLGMKILSTDKIGDALNDANRNRLSIADGIRDNMLKVFDNTLKRYRSYENQIQSLNDFFLGRKISNRFYFNLEFAEHELLKIEFLEELGTELRTAAREGEIQFDQSIDSFIEEFFQRLTKMSERIPIQKLLNPKSYFKINMSLTDEYKNEIPGSTGESYSAIALLGIARLSVVQKVPRKGLRFIILEEIGSLDKSNFSTFPEIAKEFDYQIITMAPHPFTAGLSDEWYAHHLIKGKGDKNINFSPSASYFKTKGSRKDLNVYLNKVEE